MPRNIDDLKEFDATEFLSTPEARAGYLEEAMAEDDPASIQQALIRLARAEAKASTDTAIVTDSVDTQRKSCL